MRRTSELAAVLVGLAVAARATALWGGEPESPVPLPEAHAHNDYLHKRPLLDALSHGFCSVEADVFLVDGQLLVGHTRTQLKPERTLQALYLDPLRRRVREGGGRVYRDGPSLSLLIDVKTEAEPSYAALRRVLADYADILTTVRNGAVDERAITVIISGNRAEQTITGESLRYASIDGRLSDLDRDRPSHLLPWISDNWGSHFKWRGNGPMPDEERQKLRSIVEKAHRQHRRVRFWGTPDSPDVWRELLAAKVDLINADDLARLEQFLREQK